MTTDSPRHHVLIAGQGRSGTSLLVKLLSSCGLDTHLEHRGDSSWWSNGANAGLEDDPFGVDPPYVVKSPFAYEFVDKSLALDRFVIDHAIIPIRRLDTAAASRVITEMTALLRRTNMARSVEAGGMWENFGTTPGGVVYSLQPTDVARILATSFTRLVEALVRHDVPITFLDFPRFTGDTKYLFTKLSPLLAGMDADEFASRTEGIIDPELVKVERELDQEGDEVDPHEIAALRRALADATASRDALMAERKAQREAHRETIATERAGRREEVASVRRRTAEDSNRRVARVEERRKENAQALRAELKARDAEIARRMAELRAARLETRDVRRERGDYRRSTTAAQREVADLNRRLDRVERHAASAEANFERLAGRRVVRLALAATRPIRPLFRVVRAARRRRK